MSISKRIRSLLKRWYYTYWPGQAGSFPYFGTRVYFPPRAHLFLRVCDEDIYEKGNVRILKSLLKPDTTCFDVGTNIGLISTPLLRECPQSNVVSFEPSPNAQPYLVKTHAGSPFKNRWQLIPKAVGKEIGRLEFFCSSPDNSAFDGVKATNRTEVSKVVSVEVTTLDAEWNTLGCPAVSLIKIDVEGSEIDVLKGASQCIRTARPAIFLEWTLSNLTAYGIPPESILEWARAEGYVMLSAADAVAIQGVGQLKLAMLHTQDFLLLPADK